MADRVVAAVKSRVTSSQRSEQQTGDIELTDNEERAARRLTEQYWIYRVYVDPMRPVAVSDRNAEEPLQHRRRRTSRIDLSEAPVRYG